jgi:predicted nucleotide-binding protein
MGSVAAVAGKSDADVPGEMVQRPVVFIGSSTNGRGLTEQLTATLDRVADCRPWTHGVFGLSRGTLESLIKTTQESDFAILVLTPDDLASKKGKQTYLPRDNVVFEIGLFMGALGRERTFIVHGQHEVIDLPSDLAGITTATFPVDRRTKRPDLRPVCALLEAEIRSRGRRENESKGKNCDLLGNWKSVWFHGPEANGERPIRDTIQFRRVLDDVVHARGLNAKFGNYDLVGRISPSGVLTFHYAGDARRQFSGGIVIMRLRTNSRAEMSGFWYEFDANREIYGGETIWKKS